MIYFLHTSNNKVCKIENEKLTKEIDKLNLKENNYYEVCLYNSIFGKIVHNLKVLKLKENNCILEFYNKN